ncbi:hypothetical protein [Streptomyces sp. NPDC006997]|uniref:hypothetical protein n=1 Tax=Streptomyces sp. NPDC006997 TaxID=3155356 RepID=UPI0033DF9B5E
MVDLGPLAGSDAGTMPASLTDALTDWDLVACTPVCARPWRRRRWQAPRVWTCPGCRTRWTAEGRTWVEVLSTSQVRRLEIALGLTTDLDS